MTTVDHGRDDTIPADDARPASDAPGGAAPTQARPGDDRDDLNLPEVDPANYEFGPEIARGGMGRIRAAVDLRLGRAVAIKEMLVARGALTRRFEREARLTSRLQHPAIVSVHEAGVWPSGAPFYAMELVAGRSFEEVIETTPAFAGRLALVPHALAVADAMAYAHERRVIHRDLKPRNVMIGAFGETVVLDWGLAKDLRSAEVEAVDAPPLQLGASAGATVETIAGEVLGTPAYMPPEQAAGAPVDETADVYAIGALLAHLLLGQVPPRGPGLATHVRTTQPATPEDLVAIVERATAASPGDRYPTARALAEDLRRFQSGQLVAAHRYSTAAHLRRWARRQRVPLAVAAVALVTVAVVGAVGLRRTIRAQRRAEEARAVADRQRGEAERLSDFMLFDLFGRLKAAGRLELLDAVAREAIRYHRNRVDADAPVDLRKQAHAMQNLADILYARGDLSTALTEAEAALRLRRTLVDAAPGDGERLVALARSENQVARIVFDRGDVSSASTHATAAVALAERGADAATDDARPESYAILCEVRLAQGDRPGAETACRQAVAAAAAAEASAPDDDTRRRQAEINHNLLGRALAASDREAALVEHRTALAIAERQSRAAPGDASRLADLAIAHDHVGRLLLQGGDTPGALAERQASLAIHERLAAADPTSAVTQRNLAVGHVGVGDARKTGGDPSGAASHYASALTIAKDLAARDPADLTAQRDAAVCEGLLGGALLALGRHPEALEHLRAGLVRKQQLAAREPGNASWQMDLAGAHMGLGDALLAAGDLPAALREHRAALATVEPLAAGDPANQQWRRTLSLGHYNVGDALMALGEPQAALAEHEAALQIAATIAAHDPGDADAHADLLDCHERVGDVLAALGRPSEARAQWEAAAAVADGLATAAPTNPRWPGEATRLRARATARPR